MKELQKMVMKGVYPDDIAKHFNIAISSIHNYKNKFKKEGLKFPSIKGKNQLMHQNQKMLYNQYLLLVMKTKYKHPNLKKITY